ncbi:Med14 domain-containing protein [Phanerochaete sordida]|uniref:Mediator of RNA polymerase II transcription subunit 14 n=1 Tax=Phanerochaete sordida TaxID=48140 RepID=A0A9P3LK63_9APHY|nr:Med14 domain-containing protein [Phanerochaete sordida]
MDVSLPNGTHAAQALPLGLSDLPSIEQLEHELPDVEDDQVPLSDLVSRVAQAVYAELTELAETMPHMSDIQRKRTLAEWVVKTKKQVVKLYAVVKWSRDAGVVQKAMNITGFLMNQNRQFEDVINSLRLSKESLDSARLRNHDLLTSLDVLTTGSYRCLPSSIKKLVIPPTPLDTEQVNRTLADVEDAMRYRLRMRELIPREMTQYRIVDGRVNFVAPKLFQVSLCLLGAKQEDGWFFVDVEFLFTVGGDVTGMQDFPRRPSGVLKRHITEEADARLGFYLPQPELPPEAIVPERPQLPDGVVDAPLVRLFNFLQMMSLSYQLEIMWYQAERMRSLGWGEYLKVEMSADRKTLTLTYWLRKPPQQPQRGNVPKIPLFGGTLTISIIPTQPAPPIPNQPPSASARPSHSQPLPSQGTPISLRPPQNQRDQASQQQQQSALVADRRYRRSPKDRVLVELQERAKLNVAPKDQARRIGKPSDETEGMVMHVAWAPQPGALGVNIKPEDMPIAPEELVINPDDLDVEALLRRVIWVHSKNILRHFAMQLSWTQVFESADEVVLDVDDSVSNAALRVKLCPDETVVITLDPRTGRLNITGAGDLAAAGHGPRFSAVTSALNHNPTLLVEAVMALRYSTIAELVEQKANYLGLQTFRQRPFRPDELKKLGQQRGMIYIQLSSFPTHYLVVVITDQDFRYALISAHIVAGAAYPEMFMGDIGWLDVSRIHGDDVALAQAAAAAQVAEAVTNELGPPRVPARFRLETQVMRELYAYCCARVAYTKVEQQLKSRGIPYTHVNPSFGPGVASALTHLHSTLARAIPALCVQSSDILSGAPAAEAAMPNIRVIPLNWWADQKVQVVTCVKLKYVQQPVGKRAGSGAVIRPSKRIIYDTREAVVTFLSEDVDKCVDEFLEEWARVSKMVVIAREVAQMSTTKKWKDVRLLSFDLQTVEFAYAGDYTVSITCTDQLAPTGGSYDLRFARANDAAAMDTDSDDIETTLAQYNPHADVEDFMIALLRAGPLAVSLPKVVAVLRDTLPIVAELEYIRVSAQKAGDNVDAFAKTAGWFRVLYGDFRHALDFRLMAGARVSILDASNTLFPLGDRAAPHRSPTIDSELLLRPIPDFRALVADACRAVAGSVGRTSVAPVDVGVVCEGAALRTVARALHERVLRRLKDDGVRVKTEAA